MQSERRGLSHHRLRPAHGDGETHQDTRNSVYSRTANAHKHTHRRPKTAPVLHLSRPSGEAEAQVKPDSTGQADLCSLTPPLLLPRRSANTDSNRVTESDYPISAAINFISGCKWKTCRASVRAAAHRRRGTHSRRTNHLNINHHVAQEQQRCAATLPAHARLGRPLIHSARCRADTQPPCSRSVC